MEKGSFEAAKGINPRELSLEAMKGQASLTPLKRKDPTGDPIWVTSLCPILSFLFSQLPLFCPLVCMPIFHVFFVCL